MSREKSKVPQPFSNIRYNENTCTQKLIEWMKQIREEKRLEFGDIAFDTSSDDEKRPDAILFERPQSPSILCVMEFKKPPADYLAQSLREKTQREAHHRRAPYFTTSDFRNIAWFDTETGKEIDWFTLSQIEDLNLIEDIPYRNAMLHGLQEFLVTLYEVHTGKTARPHRNIDELLIYYLQQKVDTLARFYHPLIRDRVHKDKTFANELWTWMKGQGWERSDKPEEDYGKIARQSAYLLVNKIVFYNALHATNPNLNKLSIPQDLITGGILKGILQSYFNYVLEKIDYETVYTTEFIDDIAFPDHRGIVEAVKDLVNFLEEYNFTKIGVDIVGRIFERLIPEKERHYLGQYFTSPDVVDLILRFCIRHETDKVFDPSCGTGTFLVRAYHHKKLMNDRLSHEEILKTLWGNDIAKFPHTLSIINLALQDLRVGKNYPNIMHEDFFALPVQLSGLELPETYRKRWIKTVGKKENEITYPHWFDCIVGNPPYTRAHEKESEAWGKVGKERLIERALQGQNGENLADISARAGLYAFFFVHGFKFLQNGGRFGFVVSNSWLNADYGAGLQEFFLKHWKIVAIIESAVERWFADADINTCIIILEKCSEKGERDKNTVRFVQLKKALRRLIPPLDGTWEKKLERLQGIEALVKTILAHQDFYENEDLRIFCKTQKELWEEGLDTNQKTYIGSKWEPYVYAPTIFFTILKKTKRKSIPLQKLAEVNEGRPTGANEFFYVKKEMAKKYKIEKRYLRPGLMKPRDNNYFELRPEHLDRFFFTVTKPREKLKGTGALDYIVYGERRKIDKGKTYAKKPLWYSFEARRPADLIIPCGIGERFYCILNEAESVASNSFTEIRLKNKQYRLSIWAFLNSAVGWLMLELYGRRGMGGGMLKVDPTDIRKMRVINPKYLAGKIRLSKLKNLLKRPVGTVDQECTAKDRLLLDRIIMKDIMGLTEKEQKEVYDTLLDLVTSRLGKAKTMANMKKLRDGIDTAQVSREMEQDIVIDQGE